MDEIDLYTTLRTQETLDLTPYRERARARLAEEMAGSRSRARRFVSMPVPARTALAAGGAALAVGGAVVLPTVLSPGHEGGSLVTAAWAVQARKDGTVKVTIKDASDPGGLQRALRALGINAVVVSPREVSVKESRGGWVTHPVCNYPTGGPLFAPPAIQRAVVTVPGPARGPAGSSKVIAFIHPAAMPKGSVLFIVDTFSVQPNGSHTLSVTSPAVLKSGKLPHCTRAEFPAPARPTPTPTPSATPSTPASAPSSSPTPVPTRTTSPYPSASPTQSPPFGSPSPTPRPSSPSHSASPSPAPSASPSRTTSPEPTPSHPGS